jgi:endonuclease/exonuclease/phosphatase family metal-dependent hydrolase
VLAEHRLDLSFPGREPRGAIGATIACGGDQRLQIVTTHLGLRPAERRYQVQRLLELFDAERAVPAVLLGDLNEWLLWGRPLRRLHAYFKETPAPATFPARFPLFALDRVWVRPRSALVHLAANVSELARRASDHLPITAVLECPPDDGPRERRADSNECGRLGSFAAGRSGTLQNTGKIFSRAARLTARNLQSQNKYVYANCK